jgi:hypothetical protein
LLPAPDRLYFCGLFFTLTGLCCQPLLKLYLSQTGSIRFCRLPGSLSSLCYQSLFKLLLPAASGCIFCHPPLSITFHRQFLLEFLLSSPGSFGFCG